MTSRDSLRRINGLAVAAAVLFAAGVATALVLDRIGLPAGLVRAIGPVLTLIGLAVFGLGARNADLAAFLAARRSAPAFYGGLALAAVAAGMALCLYPGLGSFSDPPPLGVAAGAALGAIVFGPLVRSFGATSANDIVATRFSGSPAAVVSGIVAWATAAATALAGFQIAVAAAETLVIPDRMLAEAIVSTALVLSVAPGGLAGVIWCSAASAGELAMIVALGSASAWMRGLAPIGSFPVVAPAPLALDSPLSLAPLLASALAAASFFALQSPAIASRDAASAVRAGIGGFAICAALVVTAVAALSTFPIDIGAHAADAVAGSFVGAAMLASTLALAGVGMHASSRAFGVVLTEGRRPFPRPASVRLARMRASQVALVIGCAICDSRGFVESRTALVIALALSLGLTTPMIALAAIARVGPTAASVAALVAVAVGAKQAIGMEWPPTAAEAFEAALAAAAAAYVAGFLVSLAAPRRGPAPTPGAFDLFANPAAPSGRDKQQLARFVIDPPIAGSQDPPTLGRILAVPGRDDAARSFDDRREGDNVVRL